jgi:hypothetical protein
MYYIYIFAYMYELFDFFYFGNAMYSRRNTFIWKKLATVLVSGYGFSFMAAMLWVEFRLDWGIISNSFKSYWMTTFLTIWNIGQTRAS